MLTKNLKMRTHINQKYMFDIKKNPNKKSNFQYCQKAIYQNH